MLFNIKNIKNNYYLKAICIKNLIKKWLQKYFRLETLQLKRKNIIKKLYL